MLSVAAVLLICLILPGAVLAVWSIPGKPRPLVDADGGALPGSISEKIRVPINGSDQGMILKSKRAENPVLLYLHGGMPDYFLDCVHPRASLRAPLKGFYTFAKSAHSPMFEEPDKLQQILREDVLAGTTRLADAT